MENYQGVKFHYHRTTTSFAYDWRLPELNRWAYLFSQLGLAPVHAEGAYGNQSYRTDDISFVITRSAMIPADILQPNNFCHVLGLDKATTTFRTEGQCAPSSESFLHYLLYQTLPHINAILHGHCSLFNIHAEALHIPVTKKFYAYGTPELAQSALAIVDQATSFFILKDHGFVALGEDIDAAGKLTLHYFSDLIRILQTS